MVIRITDRQRTRAASALLELETGRIDRAECNSLLHGCAQSIVDGQPIEGERANKYNGMKLMWGDDPVKARFLGGTKRAVLADEMTADLSAIDRELLAQIVAICELAFAESVDRVAFKAKNAAKPGLLQPVEKYSYDNDPPLAFLAAIRQSVRDRLFAALTPDENAAVLKELENAATLIDELLADASPGIAAALGDRDGIEDQHDTDRPRAVDLFLAAMTERVLGRLGRYSDGEETAVEDVRFWDVAGDVLFVAGGAATTEAGGLVVNGDSMPETPDGEQFKGTGFAQGNTTSVALEDDGLVAVEYFRHSGGEDGNPIHARADGKRLSETEARAGTTAGCRCWHDTVYEEAE